MEVVTHTFLTLDGVMQGPGGAGEDPSGGFGRGGWLVPFSDADMGVIAESWFARTEAILLAAIPTRRCVPTGARSPTRPTAPRPS